MTTAGWVVMLVSVGSVLALAAFCLYRVLTLPAADEQGGNGRSEVDSGDGGQR